MSVPRLLYAYEGRSDYAREEPVIRGLSASGPVEQWLACARSPESDPRVSYFGDRELPAQVLHLGVDTGQADFRLGRLLIAMSGAIGRVKPHAVLTAGGSDTALAAALAGARNGVSTIRLDGGVRGGVTPRVHATRRIADALADLLFVRDERSSSLLRAEGIAGERIRQTPDPIEDYLREHLREDGDGGDGGTPGRASVEEEKHVLACFRPGAVEEHAHEFGRLWERLREVAVHTEAVVVVPLESGLADLVRTAGATWSPDVRPIQPPDFGDLVQLIRRARLVISDCDEVLEEADLLGVPRARLADLLESPEAPAACVAGRPAVPGGRVAEAGGAGSIASLLLERLCATAGMA